VTLPVPDEAARDLYGRLRRFLPGVVLDVGCGTGAIALELARAAVRGGGAGFGPGGAGFGTGAYAARPGGLGFGPSAAVPAGLVLLDAVDLRGSAAAGFPFVLGDACALPFASHSLGGVHLARVLHHVSDWRSALWEARRVVRPGGAVAVTLGGRMFASELAPLREAVFDEGRRLGLHDAHHGHGPSGYDDVDQVLGRGQVVEVSFPQRDTPRQVVFDAASHPYAWLPGQDLSPLQAIASQVLERSGLDPDQPVEHERVISYRVYVSDRASAGGMGRAADRRPPDGDEDDSRTAQYLRELEYLDSFDAYDSLVAPPVIGDDVPPADFDG
jgi:SAM-dependent methyltransferase